MIQQRMLVLTQQLSITQCRYDTASGFEDLRGLCCTTVDATSVALRSWFDRRDFRYRRNNTNKSSTLLIWLIFIPTSYDV